MTTGNQPGIYRRWRTRALRLASWGYGKSARLRSEHMEYVFVMGHMRSGSSLLSRILMSNEQVYGLGERNAAYESSVDLWKLALTCRIRLGQNKEALYYLDQINHNHFNPNWELIEAHPIKLIFLIRKPAASINSLLRLTKEHYGSQWPLDRATDYYRERLHFLGAMKKQHKGASICIQYENLVDQPERVLKQITNFLGLRESLKPSYSTQGPVQSGDPSELLQSGRISKQVRELIEIPEEALRAAMKVYRETLTIFAS